jgi:HSP20 family molecular chaperone IbpA
MKPTRNIHFYPSHAGIEDIVDQFFGQVFSNTKTVSKYPLTDVYTKNGIAHLEIAVAGFSKNDISVTMDDDSLRITGSKPEEPINDGREYIKQDIAKRNFDVAYSLMFPVDHVEAEINDGILKIVVIPAVKQVETKQIEIK